MAFHDLLFPVELRSQQSTPVWPVDIINLGGGGEQRVVLQPNAHRQYEATHSALTLAQARDIVKFFNARRAQGYSFKVRDRLLYTATAEPFGTGGGVSSTNQLIINEGDSANAWNREIYLPESGTVQIRANGNLKVENTDYTLNYNGANGGLVTWLTSVSGQTLTWSGQFFVPVRFDTPSLPDIEVIVWRSNNTGAVKGPTIPLIEVDYPGEFV
jgi:uncharacterized protein (TIGR02217 family)